MTAGGGREEDLLRKESLDRLLEAREGIHVSLYMPTHLKGPDVRQDPVRLKNLLRDAEDQLESHPGGGASGAGSLLGPMRELVEDREYWQHRTEGLALFSAGGFHVRLDLPEAVEESALVSSHFHIKPLLPMIHRQARFHLLALSQNATVLYACDRYGARRVRVEGMPSSLEEALEAEGEEPTQQLQAHTASPAKVRGGHAAAIHHGQGGGADDARERQLRFCRAVDRSLARHLGASGTPVVLAGVESLLAVYREASSLGSLLEAEEITGSPDGASGKDLHAGAWEIIRPRLDEGERSALARFQALSGSGSSLATADTLEIVPAAFRSRVDCLMVVPGPRVWGTFDPGGGHVEIHGARRPGDAELTDLAALETLRRGGRVFAVSPGEMPADSPAAAILRF